MRGITHPGRGTGQMRAIVRRTVSALTPAQALVAAAQANGCSGLLLPTGDYYTAPLDAPGVLLDALGGVTYTAQSAAGTPTLVNDGSGPNGVPYLSANGINQTLAGGQAETVACYVGAFRSPLPALNNFAGILENYAGGSGNRLGYFYQGRTEFAVDGVRAVRRNTVALASPYDIAPATDWQLLTVYVGEPEMQRTLALFQLANLFFLSGHLAALAKWSTAPTDTQRANMEAALSAYTGIALAA